MRLLVLNANTSAFVTQRVADAVASLAMPGTEIVPVTGTFGGRVIEPMRARAPASSMMSIALSGRKRPVR